MVVYKFEIEWWNVFKWKTKEYIRFQLKDKESVSVL